MSNSKGYLHVLLRHHEGEAALRRALCARDDPNILLDQAAVRTLNDSGYIAHGLADHRDQRNRRIVHDMLQFFGSQIMRELST